MSHEISISKVTGRAEIAYVGEKPWHGLGQELDKTATIEDWIVSAGMAWEVVGTPVRFNTDEGVRVYTGQQVLYRNDSYQPLSVVSEDFKVVQPGEVLDFFRDLTEQLGMTLSVAGCLFNGRRFWATAETGRVAEVIPGDKVRGQLVLMTGVDGTLATTAKFVSTRVVCNNTLQIAMSESGGGKARRTHRQTFDPLEVKIDLGLVDGAWDAYIASMRKLAAKKMADDEAAAFFKRLLVTKKDEKYDNGMALSTRRAVDDLMTRLRSGLGAELGRGTAWNVLNAVTEKYTHGTARRDSDRQFVNSLYGTDAVIKNRAVAMLENLVGAA